MKFKAGDRVHVTRLNDQKVDFYATLVELKNENLYELVDCSDSIYTDNYVYKYNVIGFGANEFDYYTLVADEEDSEKPEVQYIDSKNILNTHGGNNMPTIKTKKEMNLPELIEWAIKKDIKDEKFYSKNGCHISIDFRGHVFLWDIRLNEIFTVEVEEEITEDTVIPKVIAVFKHNANLYTDRLFSKSINEILKLDDKVKGSVTKTIYVLNNDGTLTLIWRDGKLVE